VFWIAGVRVVWVEVEAQDVWLIPDVFMRCWKSPWSGIWGQHSFSRFHNFCKQSISSAKDSAMAQLRNPMKRTCSIYKHKLIII
jgi:hypothetical protein